jgi:hypothetical protein
MTNSKKHKLKAVFITEDGKSFLCVRQLYANDLRTGQFLDEKLYQGRRFKLEEESNDNEQHQPSGS